MIKSLRQKKELKFKPDNEISNVRVLKTKKSNMTPKKIELLRQKQRDKELLYMMKNDNKLIKNNQLTEDGKEEAKKIDSLKYENLNRPVNELEDVINNQIKKIENMNVDEIEKMNINTVNDLSIEHAINVNLNKIDQLQTDLSKLIKLNVDKDTLHDIIYEMTQENDDPDFKRINSILIAFNKTLAEFDSNDDEDKKKIKEKLKKLKDELSKESEKLKVIRRKAPLLEYFNVNDDVEKEIQDFLMKNLRNIKSFDNYDLFSKLMNRVIVDINNKNNDLRRINYDLDYFPGLYEKMNNILKNVNTNINTNKKSQMEVDYDGESIVLNYYDTEKNLKDKKPFETIRLNDYPMNERFMLKILIDSLPDTEYFKKIIKKTFEKFNEINEAIENVNKQEQLKPMSPINSSKDNNDFNFDLSNTNEDESKSSVDEGEGLIKENITSSKINKLMKEINVLKDEINDIKKTLINQHKYINTEIKKTETKTNSLLDEIKSFNKNELKKPPMIERIKNDDNIDIKKIMEQRRKDIKPDDYEEDEDDWAEGIDSDASDIINYYKRYFKK